MWRYFGFFIFLTVVLLLQWTEASRSLLTSPLGQFFLFSLFFVSLSHFLFPSLERQSERSWYLWSRCKLMLCGSSSQFLGHFVTWLWYVDSPSSVACWSSNSSIFCWIIDWLIFQQAQQQPLQEAGERVAPDMPRTPAAAAAAVGLKLWSWGEWETHTTTNHSGDTWCVCFILTLRYYDNCSSYCWYSSYFYYYEYFTITTAATALALLILLLNIYDCCCSITTTTALLLLLLLYYYHSTTFYSIYRFF